MTGGLYRKRAVDALFIELYLLVDNIFISALKSDMLAAMRLDELRKSCGGYGVGNYNRTRLVFKYNSRYHGDKAVAVEFSSVREDTARSVNIGVKHNAEIGFCLFDPLGGAVYHDRRLWVRHIYGEVAVRFEIHARRDLSAQRSENFGSVEAARAVSGVYHYSHTRKRFVGFVRADALADKRAQVRGVLLHMVARGYFYMSIAELDILGFFKYVSDIGRIESAVDSEKFESVSIAWMVARSHLNGAVAGQIEHRHEHGGSGAERAIDYIDPAQSESPDDRRAYTPGRKARIVTYGNGELIHRFACLFGKKIRKRRARL